MRHEAAFLELILKNPHEDGPRLVYADWLEENGQCDRAEFIRIQCELAQLRPDNPRRLELETRERDLLLDYRQEWRPVFDRPYVGDSFSFDFRRGFPEIHTDIRSLVELEYQFAAGIPVPAMHVTSESESLAVEAAELFQRFFDFSFLDRLVSIEITLSGRLAVQLLTSQLLTGLRRLALTCFDLSGAAAKRLAILPAMAGVVDLRLNVVNHSPGPHNLGNRVALGFAGSTFAPKLQKLDLSGNDIGNVGAIALARAAVLSELTYLDLGSNYISEEGSLALAESPHLGKIEWLNLAYNLPGPRGEEMLRKRFGERVHLR